MCPAPFLLPILEIKVKPSGPSWETESFSVPATGMIASTLNLSQAADISYNHGIMRHGNHASKHCSSWWRAGLKKEKGTEAKERGRKGKLEDNEKTSGFITLLGFGPFHLDEMIELGNVESVTYFFPDIGKFCLKLSFFLFLWVETYDFILTFWKSQLWVLLIIYIFSLISVLSLFPLFCWQSHYQRGLIKSPRVSQV